MKMKILQAKAGKTGGPLTRSQGSRTMAGSGLLKELGEIVAGVSRARKVLLVSDVNTDRLYSRAAISSLENAGFQVRRYTLLPGEEQKNLTALQGIYEAMASFPLGRQDLILGLGGGAVCRCLGIGQFHRRVAAGVSGACSPLMLPEPPLHIRGGSGIQTAVSAAEHIDIPRHTACPLSAVCRPFLSAWSASGAGFSMGFPGFHMAAAAGAHASAAAFLFRYFSPAGCSCFSSTAESRFSSVPV